MKKTFITRSIIVMILLAIAITGAAIINKALDYACEALAIESQLVSFNVTNSYDFTKDGRIAANESLKESIFFTAALATFNIITCFVLCTMLVLYELKEIRHFVVNERAIKKYLS